MLGCKKSSSIAPAEIMGCVARPGLTEEVGVIDPRRGDLGQAPVSWIPSLRSQGRQDRLRRKLSRHQSFCHLSEELIVAAGVVA
jgi:hypothetical protein